MRVILLYFMITHCPIQDTVDYKEKLTDFYETRKQNKVAVCDTNIFYGSLHEQERLFRFDFHIVVLHLH